VLYYLRGGGWYGKTFRADVLRRGFTTLRHDGKLHRLRNNNNYYYLSGAHAVLGELYVCVRAREILGRTITGLRTILTSGQTFKTDRSYTTGSYTADNDVRRRKLLSCVFLNEKYVIGRLLCYDTLSPEQSTFRNLTQPNGRG